MGGTREEDKFMSKNGNTLVPSVHRAARILKLYSNGDENFGVSELARRLEVNKSTLHGILGTLTYHRLLERDEKTKTYRLGYELYALGSRVHERVDVRDVAHPFVLDFARTAQETVLLGVFQDEHVVIVDREEAPHELKISARFGQRLPFNAGAFGSIFGAALREAQLRQLIKRRGLKAFTKKTVTKPTDYLHILSNTRAQGYAIDREEFIDGVRAVAAPVNDVNGKVVATLCVVGLSGRMTDARLESLAIQVRACAEAISRQLGATIYPCWNDAG